CSGRSPAVSCLPIISFSTHRSRAPMTPATSGQSRRPAFLASPGRSSPSIRDHRHAALLIGAAIASSLIGWRGEVLLLPVAMIFPALWAHARSRLVAALVSAGYFLAA